MKRDVTVISLRQFESAGGLADGYSFEDFLCHAAIKPFQYKHLSLQICRRIAGFLLAFAAVLPPLAVRGEKANVFFIHGANVSEQDARAWASHCETCENWQFKMP